VNPQRQPQVLTVCFAYTSRYEMASAIRSLAASCSAGHLQPADVCESLFEQQMCTWSEQVPPPDLLIRTSGEKRLSDFLLWQSSRCVTLFSPVRWPELSCGHFLALILRFQLALPKLNALLGRAADGGAKATAHCVRAKLAGDTWSTDERVPRGSLLLMLGAPAGAALAMTVALCLIGWQVHGAVVIACVSAVAWAYIALSCQGGISHAAALYAPPVPPRRVASSPLEE